MFPSKFANRFKQNRSMAAEIKLNPDVFFGVQMTKYCHEVAKFWQLHPDAVPIVLLNIIATTCEQSYVYRANQFKKPLNLYNCVVAKSSYGKSPMLNLVKSSILAVRNVRPTKFREAGDKLGRSDHVHVIINEATTAGILDSLKGCTRLLMTEEGDVVLRRMGAFLMPIIGGRDTSVLDDCRAQLINLYDHPEQYTKKLKSNTVQVFDAKLNILGGLTGELIERVITRRAQNTLADALYERFIFWVLSGDAIDTKINNPAWDYCQWPSLEQFAVLISFFERVEMHFDEDANIRMIEWCNFIKRKGANEEHDDHLASRLGKSVDAVHRIAGLCQIIELASNMFNKYIERFDCFEDRPVSEEFASKCKLLFFELYGSFIDDNRHFYITIDVVERAIDVVSGNLEQYKLLMLVQENETIDYSSNSNNLLNPSSMTKYVDKKAKKREKFGKKSGVMIQAILLFDSILFTLKTLYQCRLLKNGAVILKEICESLVNRGLLLKVDRGTGKGTKSVTIYIKSLPNLTSAAECHKFINTLAQLNNPSITMQSILDTCRKIQYICKKKPIKTVFEILNRPQYKNLSLDLTSLYQEESTTPTYLDERSNQSDSAQSNTDVQSNNCLKNDDVDEDATYGTESTITTTENDDVIEFDEKTMIAPESMAVGTVINLDTCTEGQFADALPDVQPNTVEENNVYSDTQLSEPSTDKDCLPGFFSTISQTKTGTNQDDTQTQVVESLANEDHNKKKTQCSSKCKRFAHKKNSEEKSSKCHSMKDNNNESAYTTTIAGRLCRTRLPVARF